MTILYTSISWFKYIICISIIDFRYARFHLLLARGYISCGIYWRGGFSSQYVTNPMRISRVVLTVVGLEKRLDHRPSDIMLSTSVVSWTRETTVLPCGVDCGDYPKMDKFRKHHDAERESALYWQRRCSSMKMRYWTKISRLAIGKTLWTPFTVCYLCLA